MLTIIFMDEENKIDPEVLEALEWFWTEEYEGDYIRDEEEKKRE